MSLIQAQAPTAFIIQAVPTEVRNALLEEHGVERTAANTTSFQKALRKNLPDNLLAAIVAEQDQQRRILLHGGATITDANRAQALQALRNASRTARVEAVQGDVCSFFDCLYFGRLA